MNKVISIIISSVMLIGMSIGMTGCGDNENLQKQIEELKANVEQLKNENITLSDKVGTLETSNQELENEIGKLETENTELKNGIADLEWHNKFANCTIYALESAYENKILSRTDLMHVLYYLNGKVTTLNKYTGEEEEVDFEPKDSADPVLDEKTEDTLKRIYYKENEELFISSGYDSVEEGIKEIIFCEYLGEYQGNYVVNLRVPFVLVGTSFYIGEIGEFAFYYHGTGEMVEVFHI